MYGKELDIHELIQLAHVPEIRDILALKMEEIKSGETRDYLENYRRTRDMYRQQLYKDVVRRDKEKNHRDNRDSRKKTGKHTGDMEHLDVEEALFWFVLTRYRDWEWHATELESELPFPVPRSQILPDDVIERMADSEVDTGKINTLEGVYSMHKKCFYDLRFVRFSSNTIFGTVAENFRRKQEFYEEIGVSREVRKEQALEILLYGMDHYPHFERLVTDMVLDFVVPYMKAEDNLLKYEKKT
jgi:hypothetical protein